MITIIYERLRTCLCELKRKGCYSVLVKAWRTTHFPRMLVMWKLSHPFWRAIWLVVKICCTHPLWLSNLISYIESVRLLRICTHRRMCLLVVSIITKPNYPPTKNSKHHITIGDANRILTSYISICVVWFFSYNKCVLFFIEKKEILSCFLSLLREFLLCFGDCSWIKMHLPSILFWHRGQE